MAWREGPAGRVHQPPETLPIAPVSLIDRPVAMLGSDYQNAFQHTPRAPPASCAARSSARLRNRCAQLFELSAQALLLGRVLIVAREFLQFVQLLTCPVGLAALNGQLGKGVHCVPILRAWRNRAQGNQLSFQSGQKLVGLWRSSSLAVAPHLDRPGLPIPQT